MLRLFPALLSPKPVTPTEPPAPGGLDFSAFATLPTNDQTDIESAGLTQAQIDLLASGRSWRNSIANLWQDSAGSTPVTAAGQQVQRWRSWGGDLFSSGAGCTYQTDGLTALNSDDPVLTATTSIDVSIGVPRTFIFLLNFHTSLNSRMDLLTNSPSATSFREWLILVNFVNAQDLQFWHPQASSPSSLTRTGGGVLPKQVLQFLRVKVGVASAGLIPVEFWRNGVKVHDATMNEPSGSGSPSPNYLKLFRYSSLSQDASVKLQFFYAYSGLLSESNAALIEQAIEALEGTALL